MLDLLLVGSLLQALGEEPGWRGYLQPKLLDRFRPLPATLVLFPVWWLWHLPSFLGRPDFGLPQFLGFGLGILSAAIWLTFLWQRTRSILMAVLWHATLNLTRGIALGILHAPVPGLRHNRGTGCAGHRGLVAGAGRRSFIPQQTTTGSGRQDVTTMHIAKVPDSDLSALTRDDLVAEVLKLREGIRRHRDAAGHDLCWYQPALWGLLPEQTDPQPAVPDWPQFIRGCLSYRRSLDAQAAGAPRVPVEFAGAADPAPATAVVEQFWSLMATNDFAAVGAVLADDYVLDWPQSSERIRGRENFAAMNAAYPSAGRWQFTVNRIVGGGGQAVSDVTVTDGRRRDRSIAFFSVADGRILRQVEFWPDPYPAPEHRRPFVEPIA